MGVTVRVKGAEELRALGDRCKRAGRDMNRKLFKAFESAVKPFPREVKDGLPEHMPNRYAGVVAESIRINTTVKTIGKGVRIEATGTARGRSRERELGRVDAGVLRHKLFGHPPWYSQSVVPGFFTGSPSDRMVVRVEEAADRVLGDIADELRRG